MPVMPSPLRSSRSLAILVAVACGAVGCGEVGRTSAGSTAKGDATPTRGEAGKPGRAASPREGGDVSPTGGAGAADDAGGAGPDAATRGGGATADARGAARDLEAGKADRKRFLAALDAGRVASKNGAHTEAILKFREALDVNPTNAAALGELGWAAFKAGDLPLAESATQQALRHANADTQRGMLLYNLGRVAEAQGAKDVAIAHYRRSLALRDHDTVRERLTALGGDAAVQTTTAGLARLAGTFKTLEAACAALTKGECPNAAWEEEVGEEEAGACTCTPTLEAAQLGGDVGLLVLATALGPGERSWHPTFKTAGGWVVFGAAEWEYNPGAFGIFEEVERVSSEVVGEAGEGDAAARYVRFDFVKSRHDSDMGICEVELESHDLEVFCGIVGETVACTPPILTTYSFSREVDRELCDEETLRSLPTDSKPVKISYSADVRWTMSPAPSITVAAVAMTGSPSLGLASRPLMLADGTYPLADLTRTTDAAR